MRHYQLTTRSVEALLVWVFLICFLSTTNAQTSATYDALVQAGKLNLQKGQANQALLSAQHAIKLRPERWEAYVLAGGTLMNLRRYGDATDSLDKAIDRAPANKQAGLRELRKQCAVAETLTGSPTTTPSATNITPLATQSEIVLWKSIESSKSEIDFQGYLKQYPNGTFATIAQGHIDQIHADETLMREKQTAEAAVAKRNAVVAIKVEHDHDAGVGNLFTAGATIGQCYGELDLGRQMITYKTPGSHAFSASCSAISDLELKSKYGKNNMVHMVINGKKYNFFSHNDPHSAEEIIALIRSSCGDGDR